MAYKWTKCNYKLTKDQKERGVIFSSQLINYTLHDIGEVEEVFANDPNGYETIRRLKDVRFFKNWAQNSGFSCKLIERD